MALYAGTAPASRCAATLADCRPSCSYTPSAPAVVRRHSSAPRNVSACAARPTRPSRATDQLLQSYRPQEGGFDVLGLGQAMVDFSGVVSHGSLEEHGVSRNGRRYDSAALQSKPMVITVEERGELIDKLQPRGFKLNAGGSLANSLAGCAQLGRAGAALQQQSGDDSPREVRVGMAGCVGDDHLGTFFTSQLASAGVQWISQAPKDTGTGTVIVLTTPDADRAFLSYPGTSSELAVGPETCAAIAASRVLVIEGYLWEFPSAAHAIGAAIDAARAAGTLVVITMADASVVVRHRTAMLDAITRSDLIFTNAAEAAMLLDTPVGDAAAAGSLDPAREAALELAQLCPTVVVTDGSRGSYITALGELHTIPPHWSSAAPVDTCGAGDAYAAGLLYGYLSGFSIRQMGEFAAHTAACVIGHYGPQLQADDAETLVQSHTRRSVMQHDDLPDLPSWDTAVPSMAS